MSDTPQKSTNTVWDQGTSREERWRLLKSKGKTMWFTGLSGSGKSTIAKAVEVALLEQGIRTYRLDGDNVRHGLNGDLGFSDVDRQENIRRVSEVAALFADAGVVTLVSAISPFEEDRQKARSLHQRQDLSFIEVFVDTPLEVCIERDPKGLYKKALAGELDQFTGVTAPYEKPTQPDIHLQTEGLSIEECVQQCLAWAEK